MHTYITAPRPAASAATPPNIPRALYFPAGHFPLQSEEVEPPNPKWPAGQTYRHGHCICTCEGQYVFAMGFFACRTVQDSQPPAMLYIPAGQAMHPEP